MSYCPMCPNGLGVSLGVMGSLEHFRCRDCGWTYAETFDPEVLEYLEHAGGDDCDDDGRFATDAEADEDVTSPEGEGDEPEYEEPDDRFADAEAYASIGWGTDEDYGCFGGED